jgi:hypothetical protein
MMGWPAPAVCWRDVSTRQLASLVGEGLHLACLSLALIAIGLTESAPWWGARPISVADTSSIQTSSSSEPIGPKRQRRTGAVRINKA